MTVCVLTVLFDRCGVIARRRSLAVERRDSIVPESLTQLASPLTRGVAGTKCETSTMPPEGRSRGVDDARSPDIVEIVGGDTVAESAVDEIKAAVVAPEDEFRPADASSVAWCLSWPDSWVVTNGERSIEVVDIEVTNSQEGTVDEISTDSGTVSPISTSGVVCPWHFGCRGPSPSPSGISVVWMDRFRR